MILVDNFSSNKSYEVTTALNEKDNINTIVSSVVYDIDNIWVLL